MMEITKQRIADCDRSTDGEGNFTSTAWEWAVSHGNEEIAVFSTEAEAEAFVAESFEAYIEFYYPRCAGKGRI